ncbi:MULTISPECIES: SURF1 family protein [unclassified Novosphingobium]|uniref:SURF1 family protein n=1 Tax=unclassified Novosphingobium TaxID=2644732 RepID=UPI00135B3225|nr:MULTISPECIES: SURF1 family protein [unclassified Novosphingobium]
MALAVFATLGVWQVQRMQWKHALIARVDARVHAAPVDLPADAGARDLEYLRVKLSGVYQGSATALVRAATDLGTGYWTMTPLRMDDGRQVWINRGFVPEGTPRAVAAASTPEGRVTVAGLLRLNEPKGSVLQANRPQDDRWYSRDVAGLAAARKLGAVVPAFVDVQVEQAAQIPPSPVKPVSGLTQIHFPDNHLTYALTWFALTALSAFGLVYIWRRA